MWVPQHRTGKVRALVGLDRVHMTRRRKITRFSHWVLTLPGHMKDISLLGCAPEGAREGSNGEDSGASGKSSLRTSGCLGSRVMSKAD